jgi:hypothetical protein
VPKINVAYIKQHPVMFGAIFLVFGVFLWLLLNRSGGASASGTTVVTSQPSDAQVAAGVALQQAQLGSQTQIALAQLSLSAHSEDNATQKDLAALAASLQVQQIQAEYNLGKGQLEASVASLGMQLANNLAITNSNNSFMLGYAKNAQDAATTQLLIGANLQQQLGAQQLEAFKTSAVLSVIPTLKSKDRDEALEIVSGSIYGHPVSYYNGPGAATVYGAVL